MLKLYFIWAMLFASGSFFISSIWITSSLIGSIDPDASGFISAVVFILLSFILAVTAIRLTLDKLQQDRDDLIDAIDEPMDIYSEIPDPEDTRPEPFREIKPGEPIELAPGSKEHIRISTKKKDQPES